MNSRHNYRRNESNGSGPKEEPAPPIEYLNTKEQMFYYQGLIVMKNGRGAIVETRNRDRFLIPKSNHVLGHWVTFELFKINKEKKEDFDGLVDINRIKVIEPVLPTFLYKYYDRAILPDKEVVTVALFINDPSEIQSYVSCDSKSYAKFKEGLDRIPKMITRRWNEDNHSDGYWDYCSDFGEVERRKLLRIEDKHCVFEPEEYIEKVKNSMQWLKCDYNIPTDLQEEEEKIEILQIIGDMIAKNNKDIAGKMRASNPRDFDYLKRVTQRPF